MVGLNKFACFSNSLLILLTANCLNPAHALTSSHHKKHKISAPAPVVHESTPRSRHSKHHISSKSRTSHASKHIAAKPRYAYPMGFFLMEPPTFDSSPLPESISAQIKKAFYSGCAGDFPTRSLVRTGIVSYYPMRGGIFWRREPIKYLIMHSTEPGISIGARHVIDGWSHGGRRHAGAHYVVERDGTIYQAVDPDLATVHINIFKTLPGINNDNSVGIEMCHQGSQDYPPALVESAARLAAYLQNHYHISDANIITHRYAQQGDHTDPVNFSWDNFIAQKDTLQNQNMNQRLAFLKNEFLTWQPILEQPAIIVSEKKPPVTDKKPIPAAVKTVPAKPVVSRLIESQPKVEPKNDFQVISPFEAKFGPIDSSEAKTTEMEPQEETTGAPLPSNSPKRLLPSTSVNRLVPLTIIINTQSGNNHLNQRTNTVTPFASDVPGNSRLVPTNSNTNKPRILPLRGPIEIDPDEAASLLNQ